MGGFSVPACLIPPTKPALVNAEEKRVYLTTKALFPVREV